MALLDYIAVGDMQTVADQASLVIQPTGTETWLIQNIDYGGAMQLYRVSAAGSILRDSDTGEGAMLGYDFNVTADQWLELKNVSGGAALLAYDGVKTHL